MTSSDDALREARRTLALTAPADFTARRKELVEHARAAGEPALATAIGAIRKPKQAAWVVNLLAHERHTELQAYVDLGGVLRARLADITPDELRTVNADRVAYVRELVADARALAADLGVRLSTAHAAEAEQTLAAAFSDDGAAKAVLSGSLTTGLQYAGLGFGGEVTARTSSTSRATPAPSAPAASPARSPAPGRRGQDEIAEVARRRAALAAAVGDIDDAQQHLERLSAEVQEAEQDLAAAQLRVAAAERDLQHATAEELRAEQLLEAAVAAVEAGESNLAERQARLTELEHDGRGTRS